MFIDWEKETSSSKCSIDIILSLLFINKQKRMIDDIKFYLFVSIFSLTVAKTNVHSVYRIEQSVKIHFTYFHADTK